MNIVDAVINLVNNPIMQIETYSNKRNRANSVGASLEEYVKDLFADTFNFNEIRRMKKINEVFSYLGNNSNPPDAMLKNGDAIEVKKIETDSLSLALNSSYPKQILSVNSDMISNSCKRAEIWDKKDIIYVIGVVNKNNILESLCMVYGIDYCASNECYERIKRIIKNGVETIPGVEFSKTKELGRINKVDPLGITYLRVRGMWGIENPWKVFDYIYKKDTSKNFNFMCIINDKKWERFNNKQMLLNLEKSNSNLSIQNVVIKDPDNPARLRNAKLIKYSI